MDRTTAALTAQIAAQADLPAEAAKHAAEAAEAMAKGKRNLSVGALLQIPQTVPDAKAMMDATFALHGIAGPCSGQTLRPLPPSSSQFTAIL